METANVAKWRRKFLRNRRNVNAYFRVARRKIFKKSPISAPRKLPISFLFNHSDVFFCLFSFFLFFPPFLRKKYAHVANIYRKERKRRRCGKCKCNVKMQPAFSEISPIVILKREPLSREKLAPLKEHGPTYKTVLYSPALLFFFFLRPLFRIGIPCAH